jgi:N-ethylmaleimide reductase
LIKKKGKVIEEGYADLVAYGKPYISNPDLVERFEHNLLLQKLM